MLINKTIQKENSINSIFAASSKANIQCDKYSLLTQAANDLILQISEEIEEVPHRNVQINNLREKKYVIEEEKEQ